MTDTKNATARLTANFRQHYSARDCQGKHHVITSEWSEIADFPTDAKFKKEKQLGGRGENVELNRYNDIVAYDQTAVKLKKVPYVNANWIECKWTNQKYIATQGPKEITQRHFWQMTLEHNITVIVMLCRIREMRNHREKEKCHQYWPVDCQEHKIIPGTGKLGELRLTMTSDDEVAPCIRRREIRIDKWPKKSDQQPHRVVQFQMTNWPDHGVPERHKDVTELIRTFRDEVAKQSPDSSLNAPILLHCSAGVGRTGTVIAIDRIQQALARSTLPESFCVKSLVKQLRRSRPKMVQTIEQYRFVYDNVDELLGLKTKEKRTNGHVRQRTSQSVKRNKKRPESTVGNGTKDKHHGKLCRHKSQSWDGGLDQNAIPREVTRRNRVDDAELRARAGIEPMPLPSQQQQHHDDFEQADGASSDEFHHSELENGPGFMAAPGSPGSTTTGGSTNMAVAPSAHVKHHKESKPKHRNKVMEIFHNVFASPTKKKNQTTGDIQNRDSYKPLDSMRQTNGSEAKNVSSHFTMPSKSASTLPAGSKISEIKNMNNAIGDAKLSEIELDIATQKTEVKIRTPKRIVHCSDGVYEEYSDEEDEHEQSLDVNWLQLMTLDGKPDSMSWLWWSVYKGARALGHTLQAMNNWGEWFADEIGITRPMYQDLIDQHNELMEDAGIPVDEKDFEVVTNQPDN